MITCQITLAAALLLPGQDATTSAHRVDPLRNEANRSAIYEQIEVMRAVLIRKLGVSSGGQPLAVFGDGSAQGGLGQLYQANPGMMGYRGMPPAAQAAVDGVYLDGYGVVFTAMLPATGQDPRPGATGSRESPGLSDWEKEQRRLHGETVPDRTGAPKMPSVGDVLLKVLAENGKHFTALKDDERLAITVTFRSQTHHSLTVTMSAPAMSGTAYAPGNPTLPPYATRTSGTASVESSPAGSGADEVLLGELHLRQGQFNQAIEAFKKAEAKDDPSTLADIYSKLAQAYTAANKLDEARTYLDKAKALHQKPEQAANPVRPPAGAGASLPVRLTVSAPKALLDRVGNGQISMDEFRKQAKVEYIAAEYIAAQ
jgi:hypothetical protein